MTARRAREAFTGLIAQCEWGEADVCSAAALAPSSASRRNEWALSAGATQRPAPILGDGTTPSPRRSRDVTPLSAHNPGWGFLVLCMKLTLVSRGTQGLGPGQTSVRWEGKKSEARVFT